MMDYTQEYDRLDSWRNRWLLALNDVSNLSQARADYMVCRVAICNNNKAHLMRQLHHDTPINYRSYCPSKPDDNQRWILVFEDDKIDSVIYHTKDEAIDAFEIAELTWNCQLFQSITHEQLKS